jgi:hypothetical protein
LQDRDPASEDSGGLDRPAMRSALPPVVWAQISTYTARDALHQAGDLGLWVPALYLTVPLTLQAIADEVIE